MKRAQKTLDVADWDVQLRRVMDIACRYWSDIGNGPVTPPGGYRELHQLLAQKLPWESTAVEDLLSEFEEKIIPHCTKIGHPRFLAWLLTSPSPAGTLGALLADVVNQVPAMYQSSPAATVLEEVVVQWFAEMFGFPGESGGILTGGGTEATQIGLTVAREVHFPGVMKNGMAGLGKIPVIYSSDQVHASVIRAAALLGIGIDYIKKIPVEQPFRLDLAALRKQVKEDRKNGLQPFCVVAQVGTSNTGAVDSLEYIGEFCREQQLWLHVDAAYGGAAVLTEAGRKLLAGIEAADSVATDPHKWFFVPAEAGCVLVRDKKQLWQVFGDGGEWDSEAVTDWMHYGIQCTRAARAFKIWFAFRAQGMRSMAEIVEQNMAMAREFQKRLEGASEWEVVAPAVLSALCFRRLPAKEITAAAVDQLQKNIVKIIADDGKALLNTANVNGALCIRVCFANHRTRWEDLDALMDILEAAAEQSLELEFFQTL
ncbi:MAG TPA: aminotransferase class I/II-fold pyridoxal phosphate-dependent enzyme [Patescibacteria group bacterium]|nr:aminotransferase class I/II-fold pyridoxal phosphate-dependent enzyme [Patescibacteria group bacterium]